MQLTDGPLIDYSNMTKPEIVVAISRAHGGAEVAVLLPCGEIEVRPLVLQTRLVEIKVAKFRGKKGKR
jgi:hypothetical protein